MTLLLISFVAGIVTAFAPCVLPLLPVIVGGSLTDKIVSKKKSLTVIISLAVSVLLFTFLLKVSSLFISVPEYVWKWISGGIIIAVGFVTVFPNIWSGKIITTAITKSNASLGKGLVKKSFWGDVLIGTSLGPCFTTCSPVYFIILATVLPVSLSLGLIYMVAYVIGLSLSLFLITFFTATVLHRVGVLSDPRGVFKKILGVIFILVGILIISGADKKMQNSSFASDIFNTSKIEMVLLAINSQKDSSAIVNKAEVPNEEKATTKMIDTVKKPNSTVQETKQKIDTTELELAKEISTPDGFINTDGKQITISEFKGKKVVLVSFWTFSCINCKRTLPYLNDWYSKYRDQGLEIVSIHTPEFAFERVQKNVEDAVKAQNIQYPVVLDNDYSTWKAYSNQYWPRKYLVNKDGYIVYDHIGEGAYEETEVEIKKALEELDTN